MRVFITKRRLVGLIGLLTAALVYLALSGCVPVTIRPQFDDAGLPKATPVTIIGAQDLTTGKFVPAFHVSDEPPTPPGEFPWESILQVALGVLGITGLGGAGVALRLAGKAKTALGIVCQLADANARADTDLQVEQNKMISQHQQESAGVRKMTQKARGKPPAN